MLHTEMPMPAVVPQAVNMDSYTSISVFVILFSGFGFIKIKKSGVTSSRKAQRNVFNIFQAGPSSNRALL